MSLEEAKRQIDAAFTKDEPRGFSYENAFAGATSFFLLVVRIATVTSSRTAGARTGKRDAAAGEDGQADRRSADAAYGCCGQALTRFTGQPTTGPGRPR